MLETPRLTFRPFTAADAPLLHALDADPEVMRYISRGAPTPLERIRSDVLPRWLAWYRAGSPVGYWAAHEKASGHFAGWVHYRPNRFAPEEMEIGYRLHRRFWGLGYATEGSRAFIDRGFEARLCERVVAFCLVENRASRRLMEKCGLRYEADVVFPEAWLPGWSEAERRGVRYGLAREIWAAARPTLPT